MSTHRESDTADLREVLDLMPVGAVRFRADGAVDMANAMAARLLAPLLDGAALDNLFAALGAAVPGLARDVAGFAAPSGTVLDQRRLETEAGGQHAILSLTVSRLRPDRYLAVLRDVTRLTEMVAYAFAASDLLIDIDTEGRIVWASGLFQKHVGMRAGEAIGQHLAVLIAPRDRAMLREALTAMTVRGRLPPLLLRLANKAQSRCVLSGLALEGANRHFMVTVGPAPEGDDGAAPVLRDGGDFAAEAERWMREGQPSTLGLLDVEGWEARTRALDDAGLSSLKREIGRLGDRVEGEAIVGEIGDGHFGVLAGPDTDLTRLGMALRDLVGGFTDGSPPRVEESRVSLDAGSLPLAQSVRALRLVLGRFGAGGTAAVATGLAGGLAGIIEEAGGHKRALAAIVAGGRFELAFQPIVGLRDRAVHHYEALLRFPSDPRNPARNTQDFVTLVETVGLARELDFAVLRRARETLGRTDASIAVNISGLSIVDALFVQRMLALLADVPRGRLLIELTETAEIADLPTAAAQIERIRAAGVPVCLDDFGSGHASFHYMRDFRVDYVKIDGSYVRSAGDSVRGRSFVRAMADLAASANAQVVAETIETEGDRELMLELGVTLGQGWLFGKAAPLPGVGPAAALAAPVPAPARVPARGEFSERFRLAALRG